MQRLLSGWVIASTMALLPVFVLFLSQGITSFYSNGVHDVAWIAAGATLLVLLVAVFWIYVSRRQAGAPEHEIVDMVEANPAWGTKQEQAWEVACQYIDELLNQNEQVNALSEHSLSVLRRVSTQWHGSNTHLEYAVTVPEALLAIETLAARYRGVLLANVPLSNHIKVSQALSLWTFYEKHETKVKVAWEAYGLYRAFSVSGIVSRLGKLIAGHLSENAQKNLVFNLKRAYLQEVANVAIDLYSGNFRRALDELPFAQNEQNDLEKLAAEVGPIRIVVVGQISSGKSTLVNEILEEFKAESGLVPTTAEDMVYQFSIADGLDTHIVDTPGIAAGSKAMDEGLKRLINADLVVWVMRANQPARSVDQQLYSAFEQYFEAAPDRQKPAVILAATHIDCIPAFAKANEDNVREVTAPLAQACRKVIAYDAYCPLVLVGQVLGMGTFRATLVERYERAMNTRLNRIRLMQPSFYQTVAGELENLAAGTLEAVKLALKSR